MGAVAAMGLGVVGLTAAVPSAVAGTCTSKTGGSSNWLMYTGNSSSPYTCAYNDSNGDTEIGPLQISSWTSSTAKGYSKDTYCDQQTGGVTLSYIYSDSANTGLGSSITFTASNSETSDRHWNAAVLWYTPQGGAPASSQYDNSCDDYQVEANLFHLSTAAFSNPPAKITFGSSGTFTVNMAAPDGGTLSGTVALFQQTGSTQDPQGYNCYLEPNGGRDPAFASATMTSAGVATIHTPSQLPAGVYKLYAAYGGTPASGLHLPNTCAEPPVSGLTPAVTSTISVQVGNNTNPAPTIQTSVPGGESCTNGVCVGSVAANSAATSVSAAGSHRDPRLTVRNSTTKAPKAIIKKCKIGTQPVQSSVTSGTTEIKHSLITDVNRGIAVDTRSLPKRTEVDVQLVCRPANAKAMMMGKIGYGSAHNDRMTARAKGGNVMGGLGDDRLKILRTKGVAFGGPGDDILSVRGAGVAAGGSGDDRLVATVGATLLIGGNGHDTLIAGPGRTLINAKDQAGGDTVICGRGRTAVLADKADTLIGNCNTLSGLG